jgi:antitoxin component YwqK of YwqJK toxin-antitoxin module
MRIIITEEQKKKLFIPRKLSGEGSRWGQWNKEQPIKDGNPINQYDNEGIKQGYWETYWENGEIESKGNYVNNIQDGYWEDYWSNGGLYYKGSFKNGRVDGPWEYYNRNGNMSSKYNYSNGKKNGVNIDYDENGEILLKGIYKNDQLIEELPITESEEPKKKIFIPRKLTGEGSRWEQWNKEQPIIDGVQINQYDSEGNKDGIWEYYYSNGQLRFKNSFKDGEKDGIWEYYWGNGELHSKELYKDDKFVKILPLTESEQPKKKLFIPRKIEDRYSKWNEQQPTITLDNHTFKLNQYDHNGNQIGIWLDNPELINKNYIKTKPFMEELFNNLKVVKNFHNQTNYKLNNKIIFQDRGNGVLTYFHNDFWRGFREKYNIFNYDTKDLIKVWMEIKYGLGHLYPNQER